METKSVKAGFTLIELLVGMAIFMIVSTMIVAAFVTMVRMKSMVSIMRDSQQKLRTANEMVSRLSRQAEVISESDCDSTSHNCHTLKLFFGTTTGNDADYNGVKFAIDNSTGDLTYSECSSKLLCAPAVPTSTTWTTPSSLASGTFKLNPATSYFHFDASTLPAKLSFSFDGNIVGTNVYSSDNFELDNSVTLENIVW